MTDMNHILGFIGIGLMGKPMTLRLLDAGFQVNVWNRSPEKIQTVVAYGAKPCASVAELVKSSQIILLCLSDADAVSSVVQEHIADNGSSGKLVIDLSSIDPQTTRHLSKLLQDRCDMTWVDAPVSGGVSGAEQGTLAIMAGGSNSDIGIARDVLSPLYKQLTHMGDVGSGQITKICNQMIVSCNVLVIAEMMALAKKSGVNAEMIPAALAGGFADSKPLQITGADMASDSHEPVKWKIGTLLKDLTMASKLAESNESAIPMSGLAKQLMALHGHAGFIDQDPSTLIKIYKNQP